MIRKSLFLLMLLGMTAMTANVVTAEDYDDECDEECYLDEVEECPDEEGDYEYASGEMNTEPIILTWEDVEQKVKDHEGWAGDFYSLEEMGMKIYVPEILNIPNLTEADYEEGYLHFFSGKECFASVMALELIDEFEGLDDYAAYLCNDFGMNVQYYNLNGIDCFTYYSPMIDDSLFECDECDELEAAMESFEGSADADSDEDAEEAIEEAMEEADTDAAEEEEYYVGEHEEDEEEEGQEIYDFDFDSDEVLTVVMAAEDHIFIEFTFTPIKPNEADDTDASAMMRCMMASIQFEEE